TIYGENLVMRILDQTSPLLGLGELGFSPENLERYNALIKKPYGIILVTGPTGSGKTTTLYASLNMINSPSKNTITIEDPVEYRLKIIRQTQINPKAGITFASGLRSILRQDPDVIMIGEIRDAETSKIAIQAALTGHLVFSTLHTNDAAEALTRLRDMGVEPFLIASSVIGVVAQRLVRRICFSCREAYDPGEEETRLILGQTNDGSVPELFRGKGCPKCKGTGYYGRMGIFELLVVNDGIRELISENGTSKMIKEVARNTLNMKTFREDGLEKALEGVTTLEEVNRMTFEDSPSLTASPSWKNSRNTGILE
ncbi:MAG: GspE/PulE family protein, partial [Thermodesulfobacteriota bacterium]